MKKFCKYFVLFLFVESLVPFEEPWLVDISNGYLIFTEDRDDAEKWRCDYSYHGKTGGWLKYHEIPMIWEEAHLRCLYEGALLASPSPELIDAMKQIIEENNSTLALVYTGIQAHYYESVFSSLEGIHLSRMVHKWGKSVINNFLGLDKCIILAKHGILKLASCYNNLPFICYKKNTGLHLNECGTTDKNYVMYKKTGSCYKFHRNPRGWSRAHMICEGEGGHLAVINSEVEAQHMKDILQANPEGSLLNTGFKDGAFVGIKDMDEHGLWITVEGQTLLEAGYDTFGQGQPDNFSGNQHCVQIDRTGVFNKVNCSSLYPFICEKDPNSLLCNE